MHLSSAPFFTTNEIKIMSSTNEHTIIVTSARARQALKVGSSASGGSVTGALRTFLMTPDGGWPQTEQASRRFVDAVDAVIDGTRAQAEEAAHEIYEAALAAGWPRHPSRGL